MSRRHPLRVLNRRRCWKQERATASAHVVVMSARGLQRYQREMLRGLLEADFADLELRAVLWRNRWP